jgi:hypothetical protein
MLILFFLSLRSMLLSEYSGKVNAKESEVQANLLFELGGFELQGFDFLIEDFGKDQLGDTHIAHQEFENNVVYGLAIRMID